MKKYTCYSITDLMCVNQVKSCVVKVGYGRMTHFYKFFRHLIRKQMKGFKICTWNLLIFLDSYLLFLSTKKRRIGRGGGKGWSVFYYKSCWYQLHSQARNSNSCSSSTTVYVCSGSFFAEWTSQENKKPQIATSTVV